MFLVSSGVDWIHKSAAKAAHLNPLDPPMGGMIQNVTGAVCTILACPPCAKARGYTEADPLEGVVIPGSGAMHELIKQ
jgi:predicted peroxiredoxin